MDTTAQGTPQAKPGGFLSAVHFLHFLLDVTDKLAKLSAAMQDRSAAVGDMLAKEPTTADTIDKNKSVYVSDIQWFLNYEIVTIMARGKNCHSEYILWLDNQIEANMWNW